MSLLVSIAREWMRLACLIGCVVVLGCQGLKGEPGPKGEQGIPGPQGPGGQSGSQGPGLERLLIMVADGGSVIVDGGVAVVSGPQGMPGSAGAPGQSVVGSSIGASNECPSGGVRYDSASGPNFVCNGAPGQVLVVGVADGGTLSFDGGLLVVAGPAGPVGPIGSQGLPGTPGLTGATGPSGGIRIMNLDGGFAGLLFGPAWYWNAGYECFTPRTGALVTVDYVEFDGPGCTGNAFFSGGAQSTMNGAPDLFMGCFYLPNLVSSGRGKLGRLALPLVRVPVTIRSVATRTVNAAGTCADTAPAASDANLFQELPVNPSTNAPYGFPNAFLIQAP